MTDTPNTDERRAQILAGLQRVMADKGYERASVTAIAKAAAGETVFHGFLGNEHLEAARAELEAIVDDLNDRTDADDEAAAIGEDELRRRLGGFLVQ